LNTQNVKAVAQISVSTSESSCFQASATRFSYCGSPPVEEAAAVGGAAVHVAVSQVEFESKI
jgi:hypothetical protein